MSRGVGFFDPLCSMLERGWFISVSAYAKLILDNPAVFSILLTFNSVILLNT